MAGTKTIIFCLIRVAAPDTWTGVLSRYVCVNGE
jgi:hypothetical protein